jgi:geranylgeranyl pyrophosphate synthase
MMNAILESGFSSFLCAVDARLNSLAACPLLHAEQRALVTAQIDGMRRVTLQAGHAQPLGLLYWVLRAWEKEPTEQAEWLGALGVLCMCSLDLFDDVQDEDLEGKPCADAGPAIATNTALALMFLAIDALRQAQQLETRPEVRDAYVAAFNRVSLRCVGCQHQDLLGARGARERHQVMERDSGKTGLVTLFLECGALFAGCSPPVVEGYRRIGGKLAALVQIVDDLRDVFGKLKSPDLATGKLTYPLACFHEQADAEQSQRFDELARELPGSLPEIGQLLYESGSVEQCALTIDQLRQEIHEELLAMGNNHGAQRVLLRIVDDLSQAVYTPDNLELQSDFWHTTGSFSSRLRQARANFEQHAAAWEAPPLPQLIPWQQAHFFTQPEQGLCFYPDVDDLPDEALWPHALLLGDRSLRHAAEALSQNAEFFIAHEMFHAWRHAAERVSDDHWHEEYVCDRLALAYLQRFYPQTADTFLRISEDIARRHHAGLSLECRALIDQAPETVTARECALDHMQTALWHANVAVRLATHVGDFNTEMTRWLGAIEQRQTAA